MKPLPEGYYREPIVAWVISTNSNGNETTVKLEAGIVPSIDGIHAVIVENFYGCSTANTAIIPALPNSFKIFTENPDGEIAPFCYEIDGVFTVPWFNKRMGE